jgi:hypothetical protein
MSTVTVWTVQVKWLPTNPDWSNYETYLDQQMAEDNAAALKDRYYEVRVVAASGSGNCRPLPKR